MKSSKNRQPRKRCQTCLKHENGKGAKDSTEADPPTARYQARSAKIGRIQRKDQAQQQAKRKENTDPQSAERLSSATIKEECGDARVECKKEASRTRRAVASDHSANDIAKQVKMNRKREKVIITREEKAACDCAKSFCQNQTTERETRGYRRHASGAEQTDGPRRDKRPRCKLSL